MPKYFISFLLLLSLFACKLQAQDSLRNPLDIPTFLSGTFAELRSNHFHSGLDIKTQSKEGLKVHAADAGYVYRIKISRGGYGKALYIKHPNGLVTVYGHLKKYNSNIESYIKRKQYKKKTYEIELFPYKIELPVRKGEVVAYSGNTGGSSGPHLHFEVRNQLEHPLNPMRYGIRVADHQRPILRNVYAYPLDSISHINQMQEKVQLSLTKVNDSSFTTNAILAYGQIGIGVEAFDRQDESWNKNGLYKVQMFLNDLPVFEYVMDEFSFSNSHYINTMIDYEHYQKTWKRIQKLWVEPYNHLEIYTQLVNDGIIEVGNKRNYYIKVILSDFDGNKTYIKIPVYGYKSKIVKKKVIQKTDYQVKADSYTSFKQNGIEIFFPKGAAYYDFYMDLKPHNNGIEVIAEGVPLHKSYQIRYPLNRIPPRLQRYAYISHLGKKGHKYYTTTYHKDSILKAYTKRFGVFEIAYDSIAPYVKPANFRDKSKLNNYRYLQFKVGDKQTGIKSYNGYIDGQWIRLAYEPKKALLTYDFSDLSLTGYKHSLKVVVVDLLGNKAVLDTYFYRK